MKITRQELNEIIHTAITNAMINESFTSTKLQKMMNMVNRQDNQSIQKILKIKSKELMLNWATIPDSAIKIINLPGTRFIPKQDDLVFWFTDKKLNAITKGKFYMTPTGKLIKYKKSEYLVGQVNYSSGYSKNLYSSFKGLRENSDVAFVINIMDAKDDSLNDLRDVRSQLKANAFSLMSKSQIRQIAKDNMRRYKQLLSQKRDNPEKIDKDVNIFVTSLTNLLMDTIKDKPLNKYNRINLNKIKDTHGWTTDITNVIKDVLNEYSEYLNLTNEYNEYVKRHGEDPFNSKSFKQRKYSVITNIYAVMNSIK